MNCVRWAQLGHDPQISQMHPDCADFLLDSGLAYQIAGMANSRVLEANKHKLQTDATGQPLILVEGVPTPWEEVKKRFGYVKRYHTLHAKENPNERWTYTSYQGITKRDMYKYDAPFHVYELEPSLVARIQQHAQVFSADPQKDHVLQICTSLGKLSAKANSILKAVGRKMASHYALRVLTPDGKLYSLGLRRDLGQQEEVGLATALGRVKGVVAMNDFDELRPHSGRYITSIPITSEQAAKILHTKAYEFDYLDANCVKHTVNCLQIAQVPVEAKVPLEKCINDIALSFFKKIPLIGGVVRTLSKLTAMLPELPKPLTWLPNKILALFKNALIWSLGWTTSSALVPKRSISAAELLDEELSNLHYPRALMRWQKQQPTTSCHSYTGKPELALF